MSEKMSREIYPEMRLGAKRFETQHNGGDLLARFKELLIQEDVMNPKHPIPMRALFSLVNSLEAAGDYNYVYEIALRDIFKVVPTDVIIELPDGDQTKKEFWERHSDFTDYIMYTMMNSRSSTTPSSTPSSTPCGILAYLRKQGSVALCLIKAMVKA